MKQLSVAALLWAFIFSNACTREKREDIIPGILGTWKLDRTVEQEYHPVNTLTYDDTEAGLPGDSIVIKGNRKMYSYEDGDTEGEEVPYKIINDSTISIDDEIYKIRQLTSTSFYLHEEETDQALDERWIYQVYLKR